MEAELPARGVRRENLFRESCEFFQDIVGCDRCQAGDRPAQDAALVGKPGRLAAAMVISVATGRPKEVYRAAMVSSLQSRGQGDGAAWSRRQQPEYR